MTPSQLQRLRDTFIRRFRRIPQNTTPGDAAFLRFLIESSQARRGLEIGTATGYGAIWMGFGFEHNGGRLTAVEIDPDMVEIARRNIVKTRLEETVAVVEGDALEVIPNLKGRFDFVFIDAIKSDYLKYFKAVEPKLRPGAVIVADNIVQFAVEVRPFLRAVSQSPNYHTAIVRASEEKHDGMAVSYKLK